MVCGDLWKLMRMYCFLRFFLKCVFVWLSVFSTTVAFTKMSPGSKMGLPTSVKSRAPARSTLSRLISSPIVGGQYPSTRMISPGVTLNCLPHRWTTAKSRPCSDFCTCRLMRSQMLRHSFCWSLAMADKSTDSVAGLFCCPITGDMLSGRMAPTKEWDLVMSHCLHRCYLIFTYLPSTNCDWARGVAFDA